VPTDGTRWLMGYPYSALALLAHRRSVCNGQALPIDIVGLCSIRIAENTKGPRGAFRVT
jgi:hypothetical protein